MPPKINSLSELHDALSALGGLPQDQLSSVCTSGGLLLRLRPPPRRG